MLPGMPAVTLMAEAVDRVRCGRDISPADVAERSTPNAHRPLPDADSCVCVLDRTGELIAIAQPTTPDGFLHPSVVLM
jgi:hypothetical protein